MRLAERGLLGLPLLLYKAKDERPLSSPPLVMLALFLPLFISFSTFYS